MAIAADKTKLAIVKKVLSLKDEAALENIHAYLAAEPSAPWSKLHPDVQNMLEKSLGELDRGEGRSHAEVMAAFSKWLKPSAGRRRPKQVSSK